MVAPDRAGLRRPANANRRVVTPCGWLPRPASAILGGPHSQVAPSSMNAPILSPMLALVALTLLVWIALFVERLWQMQTLRIDPQQVADAKSVSARIPRTQASDNFRNLFELPVLFYALCLSHALLDSAGPVDLALAWAFVVSRGVHSAIHLSYNRVTHRFTAYLLGALCLWVAWARLAWTLLST